MNGGHFRPRAVDGRARRFGIFLRKAVARPMAHDAGPFKSGERLHRSHRRSRSQTSPWLLRSCTHGRGTIDPAKIDPHWTAARSGSLLAPRAIGHRSTLGRHGNWKWAPQACASALRGRGRLDRRPRIDGQRGRHRCCGILETTRIHSGKGRRAYVIPIDCRNRRVF